ncbi:methylmalonyl-CoA mutase [Paraburkholderia acidisoli]|uniref:Methylmalonyl-CoA mutase n=1 Tax=Paraburkholderia acidisoli TaxID=2571748 RepID=A0A7Z2GPN2_9BURK|nr:methylmalonyl-CoA mutase [Paraburkholderia acidisoli]QGZ65410.1 methylmalonyl-CoA mutase [Paraburkholderia acidisoli]
MSDTHALPRKALYTHADIADIPWLDARPGEFPFARGIHATMYTQRPWTIRQYAGYADAAASNLAYRRALAQGAKGLSVAFDLPTHRGYDSDHESIAADVGMAGVAIDSVDDMKRLFEGIALDDVSVSMTMSGAVLPVLAAYIVAARETGVSTARLRGTIQNDILKEFMARNTYIFAPEPSLRIASDVVSHVLDHLPHFNAMSVSGYHLQEAGASGVLELALTLANAREYVLRLMERGANPDRVCAQLSFFFAVGRDFFGEIAKLRAARMLWAELARSLGAHTARAMQLRMHCQTAGSTLSAERAHNNVVRTTVEAMAAVFGGTQSLHTNAWDEALALPGVAAATLARDTQRILQHEMGLCDTVDPLGGSYLVESLTAQTIDAVKTTLGQIDAQGGVIAAIESGWVQMLLHRGAAQLQARTDTGEHVIVGVNRFREAQHAAYESFDVDGRMVRAQQVERLRHLKATRNGEHVRMALAALTRVAATGEGNLLAATIEAIAVRATVGECTAALECVWPRWRAALHAEANAYAAGREHDAAWQQSKMRVAAWRAQHGRQPRMALVKLGQDGHDRGARVIAAALGDAGFEVTLGALFATPHEAARWAIAQAPDIVGVSTLAGAHATLVPQLLHALREAGSATPVVVGGIVPQAHGHALREAGVAAIFGAGTPLETIVHALLECLVVPEPANSGVDYNCP